MGAVDRIATCLRVLGSPKGEEAAVQRIWLELCRHAFVAMIKDKLTREAAEAKREVLETSLLPTVDG